MVLVWARESNTKTSRKNAENSNRRGLLGGFRLFVECCGGVRGESFCGNGSRSKGGFDALERFFRGILCLFVERQFQLGADAVGAGHQHRLAVLFGNLHQRAEAADAAQHFRAHGAFGERFDVFDEAVTRVNIDAGIAVRQ